jgi:hypothetical protein
MAKAPLLQVEVIRDKSDPKTVERLRSYINKEEGKRRR